MVRGVQGTAVSHPLSPNQWSIADVLCHLYSVEERYLARLQVVVAEERPSIPYIHPDAATHDLTQPITVMLANFRQARASTIAFLQELKAGDWQRTAVHENWGQVTLRTLVQHLVDHDTEHLNQIVMIQQNLVRSA